MYKEEDEEESLCVVWNKFPNYFLQGLCFSYEVGGKKKFMELRVIEIWLENDYVGDYAVSEYIFFTQTMNFYTF